MYFIIPSSNSALHCALRSFPEESQQSPRQSHAEENGTMEFEWYQAEPDKRDFYRVSMPNQSLSLVHNQPCKQRG
jgi:hypothetical protein